MNRNVAYAAGFFAAAFLIMFAQPAAATVTASPPPALTATTPSYTGKCPVTEAFTGTISGTPGTTFQVWFNRFINGAKQDINAGAGTIPSSGSLAVSDSFPISSSASGTTFDQIWVRFISGGQADVYGVEASFTVTCVNPNAPVLHQGPKLVMPAITLHTTWWVWRKYEYKWVGMTTDVPEFGTGPCPNPCVGWLHYHHGDSFFLYHYNDYLRSMLLFDQSAIAGTHPTNATLTLIDKGGPMACFGGLGRATVSWLGGGQQTFTAPYPVDADFTTPAPWLVGGASSIVFDVTKTVQAWASGASPNNGFVLRGKTEDNGSDGNDDCGINFGSDGVLTITQ
jgi:hypothetical protein